MTGYRDNYPSNIEAPQKLFIEYSHDIAFDYSTGKFPDGTESEWDWEKQYIPIEHDINGRTVGRHEWMRIKIGEPNYWTLPMRFAANVTNISAVSSEITVEDESYTEFVIILTFEDGSTIESDPIRIKNGTDGIGIDYSEIREDGNLYLTYSNGVIDNVGRARGNDAEGLPPNGPDDYVLSTSGGVPFWVDLTPLLGQLLDGTTPIDYNALTGVFSHSDVDGYRHIPTGGSSGFVLSTDGLGSYSWLDPTELDPTVPSWVKAITEIQITNWDTAYGWGDHSSLYVDLTSNQLSIAGNKVFTNQAHGGSDTKTFSASAIFDANDGNNHKMIVTANTTISLTNELPGTYNIKLQISGTVTEIIVDASIGTKLPNGSADFDYTNGAVNIITIAVDPDGVKDYSIIN